MKKIIALLLCLMMALSLTACGGDTPDSPNTSTDAVAVDVEKLYNDCIAKMNEMVPLDADMMLDFCGIQAGDCVKACVAISADGLLTDEIWVIEVVNEEAAQRILDQADKRLKAKAEESITYSPVQYAVVQKAQVLRTGNYIAMLVAPNVDELKTVVDTAFGNKS